MSDTNSGGSAEQLVETWKEEFRQVYERDSRNARAQTFDAYWRWVKTYLLVGGSGYKGWFGQVDDLTRTVSDEAARRRLRERLQAIGKQIAGEWSKESGYRKVHSTIWQGRPNLMELGRKLQRASQSERGDGRAIEAALTQIESELNAVLRP